MGKLKGIIEQLKACEGDKDNENGQHALLVKEAEFEEASERIRTQKALNPRVLPLQNLAGTATRGRSWESVARDSTEEPVERFSIPGPRLMPYACGHWGEY